MLPATGAGAVAGTPVAAQGDHTGIEVPVLRLLIACKAIHLVREFFDQTAQFRDFLLQRLHLHEQL
jgi:hypothetical protein